MCPAMRGKLIPALLISFGLLAAACGGGGSTEADTAAGTDQTAASTTTLPTTTEAPQTTVPETTAPPTTVATTTTTVDDNPLGALRVPEDYGTIQEAVDAADEGDFVLIGPGVYNEAVIVETDNLVIRGLDRNEVILDGEFDETRPNGFTVFSNGVAIENLTTRNYVNNGIFFTGSYDDDIILTGYRASYITAHNNGDYGVYAFNATEGLIDNVYGSGHPDSAVYVGQCQPCNVIVSNILAENNALGYSGTNSGGNLWVINSEWRNNRVGIVPNTLNSEELAPQRGANFAGNYVHDNGNEATPRKNSDWDLAFGVGIVVAGGNDNLIARNLVTGNANVGIAVSFFPDGETLWSAGMNQVRDNVVTGNPTDLVLLASQADGNCFAGNEFDTSAPTDIEGVAGCDGETGEYVDNYAIPDPSGLGTLDYTEVPAPGPQPNMPDAATAPPEPAVDLMPTITIEDISVPEL